MDTVHKMLALLQEQNRTQKELTTYLGIKETAFSEWKSQKTKSYKKYIDKIATFFNVPVSYFFDNQSENVYLTPDETTALSTFRNLSPDGKSAFLQIAQNMVQAETAAELIPNTIEIKHSLFKVSAGIGESLPDFESWEFINIPDTPLSRKADFALTIEGDSMSPKFNDGDIVLVRRQPAVYLGETCVYTLAGKGYIKKYGGDRLISLNNDYDDILFNNYNLDDIECRGLVIGKL